MSEERTAKCENCGKTAGVGDHRDEHEWEPVMLCQPCAVVIAAQQAKEAARDA